MLNECDPCPVQYGLLSFVFKDSSQLKLLKAVVEKRHNTNFYIFELNSYKVYNSSREVSFIGFTYVLQLC